MVNEILQNAVLTSARPIVETETLRGMDEGACVCIDKTNQTIRTV